MFADGEDYTPNYIKIQSFILEKIKSGEYETGHKIPSEQELSQMFSVSRVTANRAIKDLSITGVVTRVKGKGTFVCEPNQSQNAAKVLFPNIQIKTFAKKEHHLVRSTVIEVYPELQARFGLEERSPVFEIVRSVQHLGKLMAIDYSYIPGALVSPLSVKSEAISNTYIHEFLRRYTDAVPRFAKIYINTPHYPFLNFGDAFGLETEKLIFWTTDILDKDNQLLASTITVAPEGFDEQPFITFSLE